MIVMNTSCSFNFLCGIDVIKVQSYRDHLSLLLFLHFIEDLMPVLSGRMKKGGITCGGWRRRLCSIFWPQAPRVAGGHHEGPLGSRGTGLANRWRQGNASLFVRVLNT